MSMRLLSLPLCLGALALFTGCEPVPSASIGTSSGSFEGEVVAVWDTDGRNMTLREDFSYIDPQGRRWAAPAGSVVNGASIPQAFWTVIGGPFEGRYRNASVVHDVGCHEMKESWEDVHRMFYDACLCGGVEESQAKMMYYAVYHFGPRWQTVTKTHIETRTTENGQTVEQPVTVQLVMRNDPPPPTAEEIEQVADFIVADNPTAATIQETSRDTLHRRPRRARGDRSRTWNGSTNGRSSRPEVVAADGSVTSAVTEEVNAASERAMRTSYGSGRANRPDREAMTWAVTPEEQQWSIEVVRKYLEEQTGQPLAAEFRVRRSRDGFRVFVQYLQHDDQGQAVPLPGAHCLVRLSGDGQVLEVICGA